LNKEIAPQSSHGGQRQASEGFGLEAIPPSGRLHWLRPTLIYAGCMVSFPVIYAGAILFQMYSFGQSIFGILIALVAILVFDWINSALGADTGRPASMISRGTFGTPVSRWFISVILVLICLGWFGIQVEITSRLFLFSFFSNSTDSFEPSFYCFITIVLGLIFALPSIIGLKIFPWIYFLSIPIILLVSLGSIILTISNFGGIASAFQFLQSGPSSQTSLSYGVTVLIGVAAAQFLMLSDYSRFIRKLWPDSLYIPLTGIIPPGFFLFLTGMILAINSGSGDVVKILVYDLNLPVWVLAVLIFGQGTTVLVGAYSAGLALANIFNITRAESRSWITTLAVFIGIGLACLNFFRYFYYFLFFVALVCPALGIVLAIDHFSFRKRLWKSKKEANWVAFWATFFGCLFGALIPGGYPTFLSIFLSVLIYFLGVYFSSKKKNWPFAVEMKKNKGGLLKFGFPFFHFLFLGSGIAAFLPLFFNSPLEELSVILGCFLIGIGFFLQIKRERGLAVELGGD
jgi:cytosine permease